MSDLASCYSFKKRKDSSSQDEDYVFKAASGAEYLLKLKTLSSTKEWDDVLTGCPLLQNGKYLYLILQKQGDDNALDVRIGATMAAIIAEHLKEFPDSIYIYDPETSDGKELKRKGKFQRWFDKYGVSAGLVKHEISIIEEGSKGTVVSFFAVLCRGNHPAGEEITKEITQFYNNIMYGTDD